jgi:hypothetical protein
MRIEGLHLLGDWKVGDAVRLGAEDGALKIEPVREPAQWGRFPSNAISKEGP